MKLFLFAFFLVTLTLAQNAEVPSFKVIVDHFLIDQYKSQFLPKFESNITSKIQSLQIPSMSTSKEELFFTVSATIENIQISSFSFDPSSVAVNFLSNSNGVQNGVSLEINDFSLYVTADCHYAAGIISSHGDLSASTDGSSIQVFANIEAVNGGLEVTITDISLNLNDFDVDIGGSFLSDILDMFVGLFKGKIKDSITSSIQNERTNINTSIQKVLEIPSVYQVPNENIALALQITEATFSATQLEVAVAGYFFNSLKSQTPPPIPGPVQMNYIQQPSPVGLISTLLFTEYFIQSFLYAAQDSNSLNFKIQKNLNMQLVGNDSTATIYINSLKVPIISVSEQNLQAQVASMIAVYFGPELFLNCSADANAIISADPVTEKLNITSLNISNVQVFYAQDKQFTAAVIEYIAAEVIKQQISNLNDKINTIPISNPYIPFKAFLPRISTQDQYFELNIDTNDVVFAQSGLLLKIQKMLKQQKMKAATQQF